MSAPLPHPARVRFSQLIRVGLVGVAGRPGRAALSALGIAIGVAALVALLGIGAAGQAELAAKLDALGTDLLRVTAGKTALGEETKLPREVVAMVARVSGVRQAGGTGAVPGATVHRTDLTDPRSTGAIEVLAARPDLPDVVGAQVRTGTWLNTATGRYPSVVLGAAAAEHLAVDSPGAQVWLGGRWFTVLGVLAPVDLAPELDRSALIGWEVAERLLGFDGHPTTVYERSDDDAVQRIAELLPGTVNPQNPNEVEVSRPSDALQAKLAAQSTFAAAYLGLGVVALVVGGIGVANTMVVSVVERRAEIGLRRALGAGRRQIRTQFLTEAVLLSVLGGLTGVLLGLATAAGWALRSGWPITVPAAAVAAGVGSSVLIGSVAGWFPAARAARLSPTEALNAA
ncbi:ABC transporter permease [Saccharothrix xinjiangensis]|uniref:ABC transporter permease n=1 Tax=Saccharothrix xinjiangensis TaxID=204798 RepID=A0ABV9Y8E6_9PSEU